MFWTVEHTRRATETVSLLVARSTVGDEYLYESSWDMDASRRSRLIREHRNQSEGIIRSYQRREQENDDA